MGPQTASGRHGLLRVLFDLVDVHGLVDVGLMLEVACDRAQSVLLDQVFFSLDADKFKQFTALLDAPSLSRIRKGASTTATRWPQGRCHTKRPPADATCPNPFR
jgi:hypothetical protein